MSNDNHNKHHNMNRRHFFKVAGGAAVATGVASGVMLTACGNKQEVSSSGAISEADVPKDKMTYRIMP